MPELWMRRAACVGQPPELWFPDSFDSPRRAIALCERCPVTSECRAYARRIGATVGIWGGRERGSADQ